MLVAGDEAGVVVGRRREERLALVEPHLKLAEQRFDWAVGYGALVALVAACTKVGAGAGVVTTAGAASAGTG